MLLYSSDLFEKHETGTHPECVARIQNVNAMLKEKGWDDRCVRPSWMAASLEQCRRNHDREYLEQLHQWSRENAGRVESDTIVSTGSWDAAMVGAGAVCDAVERLWSKHDRTAFCAIRPPGHHALKNAPMGFCVLNNVSIGAMHARSLGFERVLIVDWDVHHGNGTQNSFWTDPNVGFVSIHRFPFYPGTGTRDERGAGDGLGTTVNIPVPAETPAKDFLAMLADETERLAKTLKPDIVFLSAGFDAHRADPVGGLTLESEHYEEAGKWIARLANDYCGGRLVSLLEGGYHLQKMPECVDAHLVGITTAASTS